jgi:hypothetical protein
VKKTRDHAPTLDDWRRAYELAARVKAMEPWRFMDETDIFGVKDPKSKRLGFVSVMGGLGEHFAVAVYLGADGLCSFWNARDADVTAYPEAVMEAPQLQLSFEERKFLVERDNELIAELGLRFKGRNAWPLFRSYQAGFVPWHLDASELRWLNVVLEQFLEVAPRFEADEDLFSVEDPATYLIRVSTGHGDELVWSDARRKITPPRGIIRIAPYRHLLDTCRRLKPAEEDVELDVFWLPTPIHEGVRPFYPYTAILVGAESGMIIGLRMLRVTSSFEDMWGELPRCVLEMLIEAGSLPRELHIRSPRVGLLIEPLCEELPISVTPVGDLPMVREAKDSLIVAMRSR